MKKSTIVVVLIIVAALGVGVAVYAATRKPADAPSPFQQLLGNVAPYAGLAAAVF